MSKPTIWDIAMGGKPPEKFVPYEEYKKLETENARLKTEVEHLMIFCNCTLIPNKELQAKVERLTKAGDAMVDELNACYNEEEWEENTIKNWNAAKEGKGQP
jgi:hypothetical protein